VLILPRTTGAGRFDEGPSYKMTLLAMVQLSSVRHPAHAACHQT
jgi:hypothetical protein